MRLGRLAFAGAAILAPAYFALRSPLPAADPRALHEEFPALGATVAVTTYLDAGFPRERGHAAIAACERFLQGYVAAPALRARVDDLRRRGGIAELPDADLPVRAAALDQALAQLRAAGIGNATISAGGVLRAAGRRGAAPWRIGLRDASGRHDALAYLLEDRDESLATYGAVHGPLSQASVADPDSVLAATAAAMLVAAGPARWRETARRLGVEQALIVDDAGRISVTTALAGRLRFLHGLVATPVP